MLRNTSAGNTLIPRIVTVVGNVDAFVSGAERFSGLELMTKDLRKVE